MFFPHSVLHSNYTLPPKQRLSSNQDWTEPIAFMKSVAKTAGLNIEAEPFLLLCHRRLKLRIRSVHSAFYYYFVSFVANWHSRIIIFYFDKRRLITIFASKNRTILITISKYSYEFEHHCAGKAGA